MSNTVAANSLTICHKGGGGQAVCIVPDICKTPVGNAVIPLPYPIISAASGLEQGSTTVKADGGNMIGIDGCRFSSCTGDEPGSAGGIISGVTRGESRFMTTSPNVKIDGKGVGRFTDFMTMNKKNTIGIFIVGPVVPINIPAEEEEPALCSLQLTCGHGRSSGREQVLQIVADTDFGFEIDPTEPQNWEMTLGSTKIAHESSIELGESGSLIASIKVKVEAGGTDTVKADIQYREGGGEKQVRKAGESWQGAPASFTIPTHESLSLWPLKTPPDLYIIEGRGEDGSILQARLESFPSQQFELEVTTDMLKHLPFYEAIDQALKPFNDWCNALLRNTPLSTELKMEEPEGSLALSWGWKEDENWEAYFLLEGKIGIDPIFGVSFKINASVLAIAGMFFAIPPALTKFLGQHIADILIGLTLKFGLAIEGGPQFRYYPYRDDWRILGTAALEATGTLRLEVTARVGSDYILSASATGYGEGAISGRGELEVSRDGIFGTASAKREGVKLGLIIETKAFYFFSSTDESTIQFEEKELFKKRIRIFPWGDE